MIFKKIFHYVLAALYAFWNAALTIASAMVTFLFLGSVTLWLTQQGVAGMEAFSKVVLPSVYVNIVYTYIVNHFGAWFIFFWILYFYEKQKELNKDEKKSKKR